VGIGEFGKKISSRHLSFRDVTGLNKYLVEKGVYQYEYIVLTIFILLGIMIVISSYDFILFYAGLELTSICSYILLAIKREDVKSHEAGMKYLLLSGLGSGFLLYGISLIYGYTGSNTPEVGLSSVLYSSTSAISSITIHPDLTTLLAGSRFSLYGIKS
jgi:NADH-quinone oxidoreductase subunit N